MYCYIVRESCSQFDSLPLTSLSISDDDSLIVTASADKNIRIWGLDFGDCHKSMFAHADSVTSVRFLPRTHLFVSSGKDGLLKCVLAPQRSSLARRALPRSRVPRIILNHDRITTQDKGNV